jgi:alcohol dehydrogenase class IV
MLSFGTSRLPANIVFGEGQRLALGEVCRPFGRRVFICTDAYLAANADWYAPLLASLASHDLEVAAYTETEAELPYACLDQAVTAARAFGPDVIVGLGGGSCMDLAKLVSLMLKHGGSVRDYYGELKVPGPIIPVIAVPTTSGTGSEVTPVAVIEDPDRATKVGISSPYLIPVAAICDPEVTYTCPRGLTAAAGADAMTHAVEAFTAAHKPITASLGQATVFVGKNLLSDEFALIAIRLLTKSLKRSYEDGIDAEARRDVMMAALMAGIAFGTAGTAAAHALQYPVGAMTHTAAALCHAV